MTRTTGARAGIAGNYDAIVLDQWGVLHDGSAAYPGVIAALDSLASSGHRLAVLSNSGKRARPNLDRIARMGFPEGIFAAVVTSGEALWQDVRNNRVPHRSFLPIECRKGDAARWAEGLRVELTSDPASAQAVLLMGIPDGSTMEEWRTVLQRALDVRLVVYCSNPDMVSPRGDGPLVMQPGALAEDFRGQGGEVINYGKPGRRVFEAMREMLGVEPDRILMVGDSLEHDIAGAHAAGWDSLLVFGGIFRDAAPDGDHQAALNETAMASKLPLPDYTIGILQ